MVKSKLKRNKNCTLCGLHKTANFVCLLGKGPIPSKVMIVGEAPGQREDEGGEPFVNKAGKVLDAILKDNDINRDEVYITNAVHCRPPDNRTPKKKEIEACNHWLGKEIEAVKPEFIITLGNVSLQAITGLKGIKSLRGKPIKLNNYTVLPTYHPAATLHNPGTEAPLRADFRSFKHIIDRGSLRKETRLNVKMVLNKKMFDKAIRDIKQSKVISGDTETSGLDPWAPGAWITSIGIGTEKVQWCFPMNHPEGPLYQKLKLQKRWLKKILRATEGKELVGQNWKFDHLFLRVLFGLIRYAEFDTLLAHYNTDENSFHSLDILSAKYFNAPNYDIPLQEKHGFGPLKRHCKYLGRDIYYTRKLYFVLKEELKRDKPTWRLFKLHTMPMSHLYCDVEYNGIYVNREALKEGYKYWTKKSKRARARLDRLFPSDNKWKNKKTGEWEEGVNWNSPQQLAEILFGKLKIKPLDKTPTGANATNESVLLRLSRYNRIPKLVLEYREATKNLNTFILPWMKLSHNNLFHPTFKIHGTVTGRPSCENPNLQQTPRDPRLRSIIQAPPGWTLVDADYSQVELRLVADDSQDYELLLAYQTGQDIHTKTVQQIIGIANPNKEERKRGKAINFGFVYGMWWKKFLLYARDTFGVIFTEAEAQAVYQGFFNLYTGLRPWHRRKKSFAREHGYVRNKFGRLRRLPDALRNDNSYECKEAERQAINSPIQSAASDLNTSAAIEINKRLPKKHVRVCGTVHDNILMWVRTKHLMTYLPKVKKIMENPQLLRKMNIQFSVPMTVEIEIGPWSAPTHSYDGEENKLIPVG